MRTQVTFDCADPHAQATFWAQVFGTAAEDHSALVDQLVADGRMPGADRIVIDGRSGFRDVAAVGDPTGTEPRLFFQRVPEGKIAKNRVHLDVHVDADQKAAEVERLVALGAELIETHSDRGPLTFVMRDPEGNEVLPALTSLDELTRSSCCCWALGPPRVGDRHTWRTHCPLCSGSSRCDPPRSTGSRL